MRHSLFHTVALALLLCCVGSGKATEYVPDANTMALWHMNEGSGASVLDASANHNNGIAYGPVITDGRFGMCRSFDEDYVSVPYAPSLAITGELTVEAWIRPADEDYGVGHVIVSKWELESGHNACYRLCYNWPPSTISFFVDSIGDGNGTRLFSNRLIHPDGAWHHVAGVYKPGEYMKLYVDGVEDNSLTVGVPASIRAADTPLLIGAEGGVSVWATRFHGEIDEVRISNKAREAFEFNVGDGPNGNHAPDCAGAVATPAMIWPPNKQFVPVTITGVTDEDGDSVTITVTGVVQDEPLESARGGNTCPDAGIDDGAAQVRAERLGSGNGRLYTVSFTASDDRGGSCQGAVDVCVPHDMGRGEACVKDATEVNSLGVCGDKPAKWGVKARPAVAEAKVAYQGAPGVTIEYSLSGEGDVSLSIHDVAGRQVVSLEQAWRPAGSHVAVWDAVGVPQGIYFYRLRTGQMVLSGPVIVTR